MSKKFCYSFFIAALFLILLPYKLYANGAFDFGYSEITRGMGGAGAALPQDSIIAAINPAGMVFVGHRIDLGAAIIIPSNYYNATAGSAAIPPSISLSPGGHTSRIDFFLLPDFGVNWMINPKSSFGITLYSLGGFGSLYSGLEGGAAAVNTTGTPIPVIGPFGDSVLNSELRQAVLSFTLARDIGDHSSIGISLLTGVQSFKLKGAGLLSGFSNNGNAFTNVGTDWSVGLGVRGGVQFGFIPHITLAVSYQPKVYMTKFHSYRGLFPDNGSFDYPANGIIGIAWRPNNTFAIDADVQKIWYEDVKAYGNTDANLLNGSCIPGVPSANCFGGSNGAGFGWKNATILKIGAQWECEPGFYLRAGFSHNNAILRQSQVYQNVLAPGVVIKNIYSLGMSKVINKHNQINAYLAWVPPQSLSGTNPFSSTTQTINLHTSALGFGFSWSWLLS